MAGFPAVICYVVLGSIKFYATLLNLGSTGILLN